MLRSDTHFDSYCTDGLITRKKQELTLERALRNADRLRQLIHGGFLHPQRDSTMSRFLQQRLAELLSLVISKSQAYASLNMTILVCLVILYRLSFSFASGVEKNIRILTKNYFHPSHWFTKALLFLWQRTAPPLKSKMHPPPNRNCTPLTGFYQN